MRISEVLGLDLDDLDLRRRQVRVMGKGGARVFQTVTMDAVRALEAWLERRPVCEGSQAVFIPLPPRQVHAGSTTPRWKTLWSPTSEPPG